MQTHGRVATYRSGCRCQPCKGAEAKRKRRQRAKNPSERLGGRPGQRPNVVSIASAASPKPCKPWNTVAPEDLPQQSTEPGPVELGVREQCEGLPRAADRPGYVALAIRLAQLADREDHSAMCATNAKNAHAILQSLDSPKPKSKGRLARLASVKAMTPGFVNTPNHVGRTAPKAPGTKAVNK